MVSWQELKKQGANIYKKQTNSRTLWIGGSTSVFALLSLIVMLSGVSYTYSGDSYVVDGKGEAYVNITTTYWRICFNESMKFVETYPDVKTELYVPGVGGKWRLFNPATDCIERGKINRFKIIGYNITQTTEWTFGMDNWYYPKVDIDPYWIVYTEGDILAGYHFSFPPDNSTHIEDSYNKSANGTNTNVIATTDKNSLSNKAAYFNGTNSAHIAINTTLFDVAPLSISMWLYPDNSTSVLHERLFAGTSDYSNHFVTTYKPANKTVSFGWSGTTNPTNYIAPDYLVPAQTWTHVVFMHNGSTASLKVYINGVNYTLTNLGSALGIQTGDYVWLGGRQDNAVFYNGRMDEVVFFSKYLSASEVLDLYNGTYAYDQWMSSIGDTNLSITQCPNMSSIYFQPNISLFNWTTKKLTQYGISPQNFSLCNYTYLILAIGNSTNYTLQANVNVSLNNTFLLHFNAANITNTSYITISTISNNTPYYINVTADYINASGGLPWNASFQVI